MRQGLVVAIVLSFALVAGHAAAAERKQVPIDDATLVAVERYLEEQLVALGLPGMAAAVVDGDQVVLLRGFGEAELDGRLVEPNTPFLIASLSKSMTALAVMQLVENKSLDLDAPVSTYLPELGPGGDTVTVRDLMHHRSGLTRYTGVEGIVGELGSSLEANVGRLGPLFSASAPFEYSNANYDTMALIVERVSGMSFADYMRERVFDPLGMGQSSVDPEEAAASALSDGHYHYLLRGYREDAPSMPEGLVGSYRMFASAEDLAHWLIANLNGSEYRGNNVASAQAIETLHDPRVFGPDTESGYAGGWHVSPPDSPWMPEGVADSTTLWHDGASMSYRGVAWLMPEAGLGFVVLANGNDLTDESFLPQVALNVQFMLFGHPPEPIVGFSDFLTRWGKHLLLLVVVGQVVLAVAVVRPMQKLRRNASPGALGWLALAAATLLDITALVLILYVIPTTADAPLRVVTDAPDYMILVTLMGIGVIWGIIRTVLVGFWSIRMRSRTVEATAT